MRQVAWFLLGLQLVSSGTGCKEDRDELPGGIPPAPIDYLVTACPTAKAMTLVWRAPGADGRIGTAARYDVRYSTAPIAPANWASATPVPRPPKPAPAGSAETLTVSGLSASTAYYFAIKAADEDSNWSPLSIVAQGTTQAPSDVAAPTAVTNLAAVRPTAGSIMLTWTAPADPGGVNAEVASEYDIRHSASPITASTWDSAVRVERLRVPRSPGFQENFVVRDLSPSTAYYFAMKSADEVPNWSELSNVARGTTLARSEIVPPSAIGNLVAGRSTPTSVMLTWTAPGDDRNVGTASEYDIRYATAPITESTWDSAVRLEHRKPRPKPAGSAETYLVIGLFPDSTYFFAVRAADDVPNRSSLSNVASTRTSPAGTPSPRNLLFHEGAVFPHARLAPINPPYLITWLAGGREQPHETAYVSSFKWFTMATHDAAIRSGKLPLPYAYAARNDPQKPEVTDTEEEMYAQYLQIAQQGFYGMYVDEYAVRDSDTRAQESINAIRRVKRLFPNFLVGVWFYAGGTDPVLMDPVIAGGADAIDAYTAELYIYPEREYRESIGRCVNWIKYYGLEGKTTMITSGRPTIYKGLPHHVDLRIKYLRALSPAMAGLGVQIFKLYSLTTQERAAYDAVMDDNFFKISPAVSIASPAQGARVGRTATIRVRAAPNAETRSPVTSYRYFIDTKLVKISPSAEYLWNTAGVSSGMHVITVHAVAEDGLAGVAQVEVSVP